MSTNPNTLVALARCSGYNEQNKAKFKKLSLSFMRKLAKHLGLSKDSYSIRFNPGGIAVSGDAILHHDRFYVHLNDFGGYWRTCKGRTDYTGGTNNHFGRKDIIWAAENYNSVEELGDAIKLYFNGEIYSSGMDHSKMAN